MIDLDLSGRRAIVTGASLGIGAAVVRLLADHGATVSFCARGEAAVAELAGYRPAGSAAAGTRASGAVRGYVADMGDATSTERFLDAVEADTGPADILVNNVGASPSRNFLYMRDEDWEQLHQLNLMSAVRCTRRCLPAMRAQQWGRVIMIATSGAVYPNAALIDYAATKAAMIATAKALAGKYGGDGVLVNTILPGLIHTSMWDRAASEIADASGGATSAADVIERNGRGVPVGRYGTPEEVAAAVVFLASNAASYVNGVALAVDGGSGGHV